MLNIASNGWNLKKKIQLTNPKCYIEIRKNTTIVHWSNRRNCRNDITYRTSRIANDPCTRLQQRLDCVRPDTGGHRLAVFRCQAINLPGSIAFSQERKRVVRGLQGFKQRRKVGRGWPTMISITNFIHILLP